MKNHQDIILLLLLLLFQSCTVYNKVPVSLEEAKDKGKVKVITNYGSTILFDKIEHRDSVYYGIIKNKVKVDSVLQMFADDDIVVYTLDTKKSIKRTIVLITVISITSISVGAIIIGNIFDFDETRYQLELWTAVFKCLWEGGGCLPQ